MRKRGRGSLTHWTTPRGAALAIAHFRAIQGAKVLAGKDPFVGRGRNEVKRERQRLRRKAGAVQAQLAGVLKRNTRKLDE